MRSNGVNRRRFIFRLAGSTGMLALAGCDKLSQSHWFRKLLGSAEFLNHAVQPLVSGQRLAQEFTEADISPHFKANGSTDPEDAAYQQMVKNGFADWRLEIAGLVEQPMTFSLAELRAFPSRTQITRHDCVEGWSCIGKWKGAPLATLMERVKPKAEARYVMFFCADPIDKKDDGTPIKYYESIDLAGAYHPQTILAYDMNDQPLAVPHGAPLRLRDERQLGYKMAKYVMRIELVDSFAQFGAGKGGYWEDLGYEWYAGI